MDSDRKELSELRNTGGVFLRPPDPELEFRFPSPEVVARELAHVNSAIEVTRKRMSEIIVQYEIPQASVTDKLIVRTATQVREVQSTKVFEERTTRLFHMYTTAQASALAKQYRYPFHMFGALKGLLDIREAFSKSQPSNKQDFRVIESRSPRGEWITCWLMLKGCKNSDRRAFVAKAQYVCLAMAMLEGQRGGLLLTKSQNHTNRPNEETSHLCHQALCVNPTHLVAEAQQLNWHRMGCQAKDDCVHQPQCLLPHRDTRKRQYAFIQECLEAHLRSSIHASRIRSYSDVSPSVSSKIRKQILDEDEKKE